MMQGEEKDKNKEVREENERKQNVIGGQEESAFNNIQTTEFKLPVLSNPAILCYDLVSYD